MSTSVNVCQAASCLAMGSARLFEDLEAAVASAGRGDVRVRRVGCPGLCAAGPLVVVPETDRFFAGMPGSPEATAAVLASLSGDSSAGCPMSSDPFFCRQVRVATERCGVVDPESLQDYVATGGYEALSKAVTSLSPDQVIEEVVTSGLRGRGVSPGWPGEELQEGSTGDCLCSWHCPA